MIELTQRLGIKRLVISAFHPQANGMVERGHKPIVDALSKMTSGGIENWVENLPAVAWADCTTTRFSTSETPFYLNCGREAVLPIEMDLPTWQILLWDQVRTTDELLAMRACQLQRRDKDFQEAALYLRRSREQGKDNFDSRKRLQVKELNVGDLVLLHDTKLKYQYSHKLDYRWLGPYRLADLVRDKGTYLLEKLDGARLQGTYAGN